MVVVNSVFRQTLSWIITSSCHNHSNRVYGRSIVVKVNCEISTLYLRSYFNRYSSKKLNPLEDLDMLMRLNLWLAIPMLSYDWIKSRFRYLCNYLKLVVEYAVLEPICDLIVKIPKISTLREYQQSHGVGLCEITKTPSRAKKLVDDRSSPSARRTLTANINEVHCLNALPAGRPSPKKPIVSTNNLSGHNSRLKIRVALISINWKTMTKAKKDINNSCSHGLFGIPPCQPVRENIYLIRVVAKDIASGSGPCRIREPFSPSSPHRGQSEGSWLP